MMMLSRWLLMLKLLWTFSYALCLPVLPMHRRHHHHPGHLMHPRWTGKVKQQSQRQKQEERHCQRKMRI